MARVIHTVKHIKDQYRKYQFIALTCALVTIAAALLAALSGLQVTKLQKAQAKKVDSESPSSEKVLNVWMEKEIENLKAILSKTQEDLAKEKEAVTAQQEAINSLKRQLSTVTAKARALEETAPKTPPAADNAVPKTMPAQPAVTTPPATERTQDPQPPSTGEPGVTADPSPREASTPQPQSSTPQSTTPSPAEEPQSAPGQKPAEDAVSPQSQAPASDQAPSTTVSTTAPPVIESKADQAQGRITTVPVSQPQAERPKAISEETLPSSKQQ